MPEKADEPRRPGPKRKRGAPAGPEEVRRAVLEAAALLFSRQGVESVSIRDIAREADVHPTLIGRYIGPRDALIDEVYRDVSRRLAAEFDDAPLAPRSFERESVMGAWTVLMTYYALRGSLTPDERRGPVERVADVIVEHYGLDRQTARWRSAQIVGSALGWRLFEPLLVHQSGLDPELLPDVRLDLNLLHNLAGSLALPTEDPRPASISAPPGDPPPDR